MINGTFQALIILDLDDFKLFNQLYGTYAGDNAFKAYGADHTSTVGRNGIRAATVEKSLRSACPDTTCIRHWSWLKTSSSR